LRAEGRWLRAEQRVNMSSIRKVDIRLPGKGNSNSHGARPVYLKHLDDEVDSDQEVVNGELSLSLQPRSARLAAHLCRRFRV